MSVLLKYVASSGNEYNLKADGIKTRTANYHRWNWGVDGTALQYGTRVGHFTRDAAQYETQLIFNGSYQENKALIEMLHDDFERDVYMKKPGKIIWGDYYIECYIISSSTFPDTNNIWTDNDVIIYCPRPFWIKEETKSFEKTPDPNAYSETFSGTFTAGTTYTTGIGDAYLAFKALRTGDRVKITVKGSAADDGDYLVTLENEETPGQASLYRTMKSQLGNKYTFKTGGDVTFVIEPMKRSGSGGTVIYYDQAKLTDSTTGNEVELTLAVKNQDMDDGFLDYPFDYDYDYYKGSPGSYTWARTHQLDANFKAIIYGPAVDPQFFINGHEYSFSDTIGEGEYVTIDSRNHTIVKTQANGNTVNLFDARNKESSIFQPVPGGTLDIIWSGTFGMDMTIFDERSEPAWSS